MPGASQEVPEPEFELLSQDVLEISWEDEGGAYQLETSLDLEDWITLRAIPSLLLGPYVGNTVSDLGILVFDDVSSFLFDGNVAPDRTFGPDDRVPFNGGANTIKMTIDALTFGDGRLYAVDTSGANVNSSRIMVFSSHATANGQANPARTITGPWTKIRSIHVHDDRLYAVDDSNVLFLINDIGSANGMVNPVRITVEGDVVALRAVGVFHGQTYFLDENNAAILAFRHRSRRQRHERGARSRHQGVRDAPAAPHLVLHHAGLPRSLR